MYSVTAADLTMSKAVSGAAARRISLPFIQNNSLKPGLTELTEVGWRGTVPTERDSASLIFSDNLIFVAMKLMLQDGLLSSNTSPIICLLLRRCFLKLRRGSDRELKVCRCGEQLSFRMPFSTMESACLG